MPKVFASIKTVPYKVEIRTASGNEITVDEPLDSGGKDTGFSPKELLAAALSACTSVTLRMYMDRKGWETSEIKVETELTEVEKKTVFDQKIEFSGEIDDEKKNRLIQIANACPVHKLLSNPIEFRTGTV